MGRTIAIVSVAALLVVGLFAVDWGNHGRRFVARAR